MSRKVNIKCQLFRVKKLQEDNTINDDELFNLEPWILDASKLNLLELEKQLEGVKGRLEKVKKRGDLYTLNFVRMGDYSPTYVVKQGKEAKHVDISIEDDEYIGNNSVAVYDPNSSIMILTKTRMGFSAHTIFNYINSFGQKEKCYLDPIRNKVDFYNRKNKYKKIRIKINSVENYVGKNGVPYEEALRIAEEIGSETYDFEFSIGRRKDKFLDTDTVLNIISDAMYNRGAISIAKVKISDEKGTKLYDLFDNINHFELTLETNDKGEVTYERIAESIIKEYNNYKME